MGKIDRKELGRRLEALRKSRGLNQEDVANLLGVSRSVVTQIENGNRELTAVEFTKLAEILFFSIDEFLSDDFNVAGEPSEAETVKADISQERISVQKMNTEKFKNVLLYILERCAGKPNVGETVLYKLLYFCDFNYYEKYEEHLTGARYRKLNFGPVPQEMKKIIERMISDSQIKRVKTEYYGKPQTRYIPLVKADLKVLNAAEKEVIDNVLDSMSDWSAKMISDYSHNDKPWRATEVNDFIDYELVFYRKPPYSVRVYEEDEQDNV